MNLQTQTLDPEILAHNLITAREASGKSFKEVCDLLGIPTSRLKNYEEGKYIPSLPELESISFIYRIPLFALMRHEKLDRFIHDPDTDQLQQLIKIRDEIISTHILLALQEKEMSYKELSKQTGISYSRIKRYEAGSAQPPMDELISLCETLELSFSDLLDRESPIGSWQVMQQNFEATSAMPEDLVAFFTDPENISQLETAKLIANIGVENLSKLSKALAELLHEVSPGKLSE